MTTQQLSQSKPARRISAAIWAITFCAFGIGTTEFVLVGLLPSIAHDLRTTLSDAGTLVTLYALGVAIGGPLLTALTVRFDQKKVLLGALVAFVAGNILAYFSQQLFFLQISRLITGTTHGLFFGYAVVVASKMVADDRKATAISLVFAGLMISTVIGVPAGTYLGEQFGWKMTFLAIALWGLFGFAAIAGFLPAQGRPAEPLPLRDVPKVLSNRRLLIVLLTNIFAYTGTFIFFTYLSPILEHISGFQKSTINILLLIFGLGVAIGNMVGGKISNSKPAKILTWLLAFHLIMLLVLGIFLQERVIVVGALFLFGFFAYSNVPALQLLVVESAEEKFSGSGGIASAINVSAFNVGAAGGSFIGGLIAESTWSLKAAPWAGCVFILVALLISLLLQAKRDHVLNLINGENAGRQTEEINSLS